MLLRNVDLQLPVYVFEATPKHFQYPRALLLAIQLDHFP